MEEQKERRLAAIEEEKAAQAHADRLNQQIPLILDCIEKMSLAGLSKTEIANLFRHAADELEKIRGPVQPRSPSTSKNDGIAPLLAAPEPQDQRISNSTSTQEQKGGDGRAMSHRGLSTPFLSRFAIFCVTPGALAV